MENIEESSEEENFIERLVEKVGKGKNYFSLEETTEEESEEEELLVPDWATFENISDLLDEQDEERLYELFGDSSIFHPPIEEMLALPVAKSKHLKLRGESANWGHIPSPKKREMLLKFRERQQLQRKWALKDFEIGRTLGKGRFGTVYLVKERGSQSIVALKVVYRKDLIENDASRNLRSEIEIQAHMRHPNIIKIYGYFYDDERVYLVLEYSLYGDILNDVKLCRLDEQTAAKYTSQIAQALEFMHSNFVIHRDIKLDNIYLHDGGIIKIGDFGWSVHSLSLTTSGIVGTLHYLAPEILTQQAYNEKIDMWALGVTLYEMVIGRQPFYGNNDSEVQEAIQNGKFKMPGFVSKDCADLILKLLEKDPVKRISAAEVLGHTWIKKHCDVPSLKNLCIKLISETMMNYPYNLEKLDPKIRHLITFDSVHHRFFSE